ncbi:MAG: phospholipase D-like domain-containing protein, partial [Gallionellaceae bacterium]|nr:phospholipase D-like domain-containing protein [Gallionellaceae bacterium]
RLDYAVKIEGGTVLNVQAAVRRLWMMVSWLAFRHRRDVILPRPQPPAASRQVMLLVRDNLRNRRRIEQAYLSAIANARHEILLANAYFLPSRNFRQALRQAAERGVKVVLLLQGKIEYRLQHYATLSLYDEMLGAGVQIYQYHASYLHAKVAVVDGDWATVGSSNIEPFSLWLAREANLVVRDQAFAAALRDDLLDEMARGASMVDHAAWSRRGIWVRVATHLSYLFMKFLTSLIGMSRGKEDV